MKITKKNNTKELSAKRGAEEASLYEATYTKDTLPELTAANITAMFNSKEFKTPVSNSETERYLSSAVKESTIKDIQEVEEEALTECVKNYLKEAYSTVADFRLTACRVTGNKLLVEGKITFTNNKVKNTVFEFTKAGKNLLKGRNTGIAENINFTLAYSLNNHEMLAESLKYSYTQKGKLIEGFGVANKGV